MNVFIFRRDLRLHDNSALLKLANETEGPILLIFIFNHKQLTGPYASQRAIEFMVDNIMNLQLYIFYDDDLTVLTHINQLTPLRTVAFNLDYTPFARARDARIVDWCKKHNIQLVTSDDYSLLPLDREWRVFTPYYKHCISELRAGAISTARRSARPSKARLITNPFLVPSGAIAGASMQKKYQNESTERARKFVHTIVANKSKSVYDQPPGLVGLLKIKKGEFKQYDEKRDIMHLGATTRLSAAIKFGVVSIREVYDAVVDAYGIEHGIIRELLWHDYYARVVWYNPQVLIDSAPLKGYDLKWSDKYFAQWARGETGVPIVDAAMRELNNTGYMHNRGRMIVASFLVKDLHCDWRLGEKYFARNLIDYDPCSNSGGWQGIASVGADASQPYFRIMNPWRQAKQHDPHCVYILRWIPELIQVAPADILSWDMRASKYPSINYPAPIVNHQTAAEKYKQLYQSQTATTSRTLVTKPARKKAAIKK